MEAGQLHGETNQEACRLDRGEKLPEVLRALKVGMYYERHAMHDKLWMSRNMVQAGVPIQVA